MAQARIYPYAQLDDFRRYSVVDYHWEKFAEVILSECYDAIKKDMELAHIQSIPIDFEIYANGRLRRILRDHFGVGNDQANAG